MRIVFLVHYFPPINSSGAKRVEALSKYFAVSGHDVTVITSRKTRTDGAFTEKSPPGVNVIELDGMGRDRPSIDVGGTFEPMYTGKPSLVRRFKDLVMRAFGQLPDPRLPFALALQAPWLAAGAREALRGADVVIGSAPPWPMLLAAVIAKRRFGIRCILDYRDHFSECHEMPGGAIAKWLERQVDRWLVRNADYVVAISDPMTSYYRTMTSRVATILNGYDHEVLDIARSRAEPAASGETVIRYMGIVSPGRIPHRFLRALQQFREENPGRFTRVRVEFFGNAALVAQAIGERYPSIQSAFHFFGPVPYLVSLQRIVEADYLLFCETSSNATLSAQGILTTKLFEYIGSGRPILADISAETLAGALLTHSGGHHVVGDSSDVFLAALRRDSFFERHPDEISEATLKLSRKAQAQQYADLLDEVVRDARK